MLAQHSGQLRALAVTARSGSDVLEKRLAWLSPAGRSVQFYLVAPEPHAVYPEKLPDGVGTSRERPVTQLIEHLERHGSDAGPIPGRGADPAERPRRLPADRHALDRARRVRSLRALMDQLVPSSACRGWPRTTSTWSSEALTGDLGIKVDPSGSRRTCTSTSAASAPARWPTTASRHRAPGRVQGPPSCELTCLVFGDSYAVRVLPFLAESFRRLVFASHPEPRLCARRVSSSPTWSSRS